jgi:transcription initiation factor TFIIF subunit beta
MVVAERTSLVGTVRHECSMSPVINEEYKRFQVSKFRQADIPKATTQVLDPTVAGGNLLAPGTTGANTKSFSGFVVSKTFLPIRHIYS